MIYRIFLLCLLIVSAMVSARASEQSYVFAAASTTEALQEAADLFEAQTGHKVKISFAGSSTLAKQIEAGAPVGLFLSANEGWVNYLVGKGNIQKDAAFKYLTNRLVVITSSANNKISSGEQLSALLDLAEGQKLSVADPDHVPAGIYAKEALLALGIWERVRSKLVRQPNVKGALALISRQEASLGIVYRTDALAEPKVKIAAEFPENLHAPITYVLARVGETSSPLVRKFENFLKSDQGIAVFEKYGFARYKLF